MTVKLCCQFKLCCQ